MVKIEMSLHPSSLHPLEAARAHHMRHDLEMAWVDIAADTWNMQGKRPSLKCVRNAVARMEEQQFEAVAKLGYHRCGRKKELTTKQEQEIVQFVKMWRSKRFCTCAYIKRQLKLKVSQRTVARTLNRNGFFWKPVPKKTPLSDMDLEKRKAFVDKYGGKPASWWEANLNLVLDGVTLTKPPRNLSARQKHASQSIGHVWLKLGESVDKDVHTYNRYGVQLGTKVPLWGGFTGGGKFVLRLWTPRAKMTKQEWIANVPALKRAISSAESVCPERRTVKAKVWHDNERFLLVPEEYKKLGMQLVNFPPNSGDLNPIENVWAALRKELAVREQDDLGHGRALSTAQFRARVAQILKSFSEVREGKTHSFLQKLVRGMPKRLAKCAQHKYGRCGK